MILYARAGKRAFDVGAAVLVLPLGAVLFAAGATVSWLSSGGNPVEVQHRIGRDGKPFRIVKLRTVRMSVDPRGEIARTTTTWSRFVRRWKLDELAQLMNVLGGSMSLVGPRPLTESTLHRLGSEERSAMLSVRPGLTGLASLVLLDEEHLLASRGFSKNDEVWLLARVKSPYAMYYRTELSFMLDVRVLTGTLLRRPAFADPLHLRATVEAHFYLGERPHPNVR